MLFRSVVWSRQGHLRGGDHFGGEASAVQLLDLHADGGAAASLEQLQGLGEKLMFAPVLVSPGISQQNLQL